MSTAVVAALVAALETIAPSARLAALPAWPGWAETAEERHERYEGIAAAAWAVANDPEERPVFAGARGRERTASLLLGIAWLESGFARDVDLGPCYRGRDGRGPRCDSGRSACLMQIQIGGGVTREGWNNSELFSDRERCFRAGLHLVRKSFAACARSGIGHELDAFTDGACGSLVAAARSRPRLAAGRRVFDLASRVPLSAPGSEAGPQVGTNAPEQALGKLASNGASE